MEVSLHWLSFLIRMSLIFLIFHMSSNFGLYLGHCKCCGDSEFCYISQKDVSLFNQVIQLVELTLKSLSLKSYLKFQYKHFVLSWGILYLPCACSSMISWKFGQRKREQNLDLHFSGSLLSRIFLSHCTCCGLWLPLTFQAGKNLAFYRTFGSLFCSVD